MSDDYNDRPARIDGDPKLISKLIETYEAMAEDMTDEQLVMARESRRILCTEAWPRIEEARKAYQYPSQAFYVFDRVINRRTLEAEIARAVD